MKRAFAIGITRLRVFSLLCNSPRKKKTMLNDFMLLSVVFVQRMRKSIVCEVRWNIARQHKPERDDDCLTMLFIFAFLPLVDSFE